MTRIEVDPDSLTGMARQVALSRPKVDKAMNNFAGARDSVATAVGSDGGDIAALSNALHDCCDAGRTWFEVLGNGVAVLATKASAAADRYAANDRNGG